MSKKKLPLSLSPIRFSPFGLVAFSVPFLSFSGSVSSLESGPAQVFFFVVIV
ncbi:hypothetical protein MtrunA17_Chr2g0314091 [Medicago truncatula]|uniref:Uncharacterized protein n=1 Tax=Medicago truncatula TaxID=3880 RepID=A0A396J938_MEDTR|nr:hypothetical protein MtrunA17_Chr2g0314091 [Medicago truncatula]